MLYSVSFFTAVLACRAHPIMSSLNDDSVGNVVVLLKSQLCDKFTDF